MTAFKKEVLESIERKHGLTPDGLSYPHRCSRATAYEKGEGESWKVPASTMEKKRASLEDEQPTIERLGMKEAAQRHPLWGKKLLICPMMTPDAKRNLAFDEVVGHEITVREAQAGDMIYGAKEEVDRMVGDYEIISENRNAPIYAKTTFPKVGTELTYTLGKDLVPVCRGNDGQVGYIWQFPTSTFQVKDTMIQMLGLKTLIQTVYPELLKEFRGKEGKVPMMWIDGVSLAASIPYTEALLKEKRSEELRNVKAGLV